MEKGIEEATKLAKIDGSNLTLELPSENFAKLFMENMFVAFVEAGVKKETNMQLNVMFPVEEDDNEEEGTGAGEE
tara:strand:- start:190 stop:414 length:225 start_codon:yes stop_codon:yes gene_type:complete